MVPKNLKVGDVFKDGEQNYKVLEVLEDGNYISTVTEDKISELKPQTDKSAPVEEKSTEKAVKKPQANSRKK